MDLFQFQFIGAEHKTKNSYASVSVEQFVYYYSEKKDPLFRLQCTRDNIYSCAQHDYHFNTPAVWSVRDEKNSKGNEEWIIALVVWLVPICRHCSASSGREWTCLHLAVVDSWDSTFLYSKFTSKVAKMFKLLVISALLCVSIITAAEVNFQKILCYYLTLDRLLI